MKKASQNGINSRSLVLLLIVILSVSCNKVDKKLPPPNIVWIVSEDNSKHYLKMFDDNGIATPNIESLATQGIIYTRTFSNAAVCSAARSTIISGSYGPRLASHYHRNIKKVPMPVDIEMFPAYLKRAGYYTTNRSKEDYNFIKPDNVWDDSSKRATWRNRKENQPFFHVFNIGITHESGLHFKQDVFDNQKTKTDLESFSVQPNHPDTKLFKYTNAVYRDKMIQMDNKLGEVMNQLKEDGLFNNTFIFYYGDHGGVLPGSKGYLYETGVHVPLVVHVPNNYRHLAPNKVGTKVNGFVSFVDLAPTVLNLAGLVIPNGMDGKPFLGKNITAEEVNKRDETFSYVDRFDEKYDMVRALRKGKYKYIRNYQPFNYDGLMNDYRYRQLAFKEWVKLYKEGKLNEIQAGFYESRDPELLFDVENDPFETINLAQNPAYASIVTQLRSRLNAYMQNMPDLSFYPEHYLINNAFENPAKFGQNNKENILRYMNIADLSLLNFNDAKNNIKKALNSRDPWDRYWGIIVCSIFGERSTVFASKIEEISQNDSEKINRVRAYEFAGLVLKSNPLRGMAEILYKSDDVAESLLILNSMVLMTDNKFDYFESYQFDKIPKEMRNHVQLKRRYDYLSPK